MICYNFYDIYIFVLCCIFYMYCTGNFLYFYSLNHRIPWNSVRLKTKSFHHNTIKLFLSTFLNFPLHLNAVLQLWRCILSWMDLTSLKAKKINELVLRPKISKYNATGRSVIARFLKFHIYNNWKLSYYPFQ